MRVLGDLPGDEDEPGAGGGDDMGESLGVGMSGD